MKQKILLIGGPMNGIKEWCQPGQVILEFGDAVVNHKYVVYQISPHLKIGVIEGLQLEEALSMLIEAY